MYYFNKIKVMLFIIKGNTQFYILYIIKKKQVNSHGDDLFPKYKRVFERQISI